MNFCSSQAINLFALVDTSAHFGRGLGIFLARFTVHFAMSYGIFTVSTRAFQGAFTASIVAGIMPPPIGFSSPLYADLIFLPYCSVFIQGFIPRRFIPVVARSIEVPSSSQANDPSCSAQYSIHFPIP